MNLTGALESQDLTTLAQVETLINASGTTSSGAAETLYQQLISGVSARITEYLGFHTLRRERTETYELPIAATQLTLDGRPVDMASTFEVRLGTASDDATLDALTAMDSTGYRVSAPNAWIRFDRGEIYAWPMWARVTYTGGLATAPETVPADIAAACALQVKYAVQRADSLGGDMRVFAGAASSFTGEYGLQREVRETLDAYRRRYV